MKKTVAHILENAVAQSEHAEYFRAPLLGFSSADDPLYAELKAVVGEHHIHPRDVLPNAKSVISFYIPFTRLVVDANRKSEGVSETWVLAYIHGNALINSVCTQIAEAFASEGIEAATIPATHNFSEETLKAPWSHRSAACIAGLGTFGLNNMLITEKGGAGRYGSVITAYEFEPTPREGREHCIYKESGKCGYCVRACPVGALRYDGFDRFACKGRLRETELIFEEFGKCDVCGKCAVGPCAYFE